MVIPLRLIRVVRDVLLKLCVAEMPLTSRYKMRSQESSRCAFTPSLPPGSACISTMNIRVRVTPMRVSFRAHVHRVRLTRIDVFLVNSLRSSAIAFIFMVIGAMRLAIQFDIAFQIAL